LLSPPRQTLGSAIDDYDLDIVFQDNFLSFCEDIEEEGRGEMTDLILNIKIGPFLDEKRGHIMTIDGGIVERSI
jgi:hypothetical protein